MDCVEIGYSEQCFQDLPPCGDGMISRHSDGVLRVMLADGIGHGRSANDAIVLLQQQFDWFWNRSQTVGGMSECMQEMHACLRSASGFNQAAAALVEINRNTEIITALCIGNVKAHLVGEDRFVSFPCLNGMLGGHMPGSLLISVEQLKEWSLLVLHSDGVSTSSLRAYLQSLPASRPGLSGQAQHLATQIIQNFGKTTDDASCTVVVLNQRGLA